MVHYSKLGISGSILIKICICIKHPDLDPDYSKIGQIMPLYTHLLVFYSKSGISVTNQDLDPDYSKIGPIMTF